MNVELKQIARFFLASAIIILTPLNALVPSPLSGIMSVAMLGGLFVVSFLIAGVILQFAGRFFK